MLDEKPALPLTPASGVGKAVLWVAMAVAVVAALSSRDLWSPDEPRYGLVARGMLESGDWLVPRIAGQPYAEKPPLAYWAMAAAGLAGGGLTAALARLACALFAAVAVLQTSHLARRWFGDRDLGDTAALLFATTGLVLWNGSRAALDLPMTACALVALEAGTVVVARGSVRASLVFGAALGLGLLTKGPHVLYVPVAALVGGCLGAREGRRLRDPRFLLGLLVAAGVVCAWILPAMSAAGDQIAYNGTKTYGERLLGQIGSRVAGENEPHDHGPLFFLPLLLAMGLPWTFHWIAGLVHAVRPSKVPPEERFGLSACAWGLLVPLVLLSVPSSKRELYLIPLLPCASLLAAWAVHRLPPSGALRHATRFVVGLLACMALGAFAAPFLVRAPWLPISAEAREVASVLSTGSAAFALGAVGAIAAAGAIAAYHLREKPAGGLRAAGVALAGAWMLIATAVVPAFDPWKSFSGAAEAAEQAAPGAPLAIVGTSDASSLWSFHRDRAAMLGAGGYIAAAKALAPGAAPILVFSKGAPWRGDSSALHPDARTLLQKARVVWEKSLGGTTYVLLTNPAPP